MSPISYDMPFIKYKDALSHAYGAKTVSNDKSGLSLCQLLKRGLHLRFTLHIKG